MGMASSNCYTPQNPLVRCAGAAAAGIDSLFIRGGIHADHFVNLAAEPLGELDAAMYQLCEQHRAWPTFTMQSFTS